MIVNFYIEIKKSQSQEELERVINAAGYALYDATHIDPLTRPGSNSTLECIEAELENK